MQQKSIEKRLDCFFIKTNLGKRSQFNEMEE